MSDRAGMRADGVYLHWSDAGGPNECEHGYAEGISCPRCDANPKMQALVRERDEARAEVERLRAALRKAADAPCTHCTFPEGHGQRNTAHFIADQAAGAAGLGSANG